METKIFDRAGFAYDLINVKGGLRDCENFVTFDENGKPVVMRGSKEVK